MSIRERTLFLVKYWNLTLSKLWRNLMLNSSNVCRLMLFRLVFVFHIYSYACVVYISFYYEYCWNVYPCACTCVCVCVCVCVYVCHHTQPVSWCWCLPHTIVWHHFIIMTGRKARDKDLTCSVHLSNLYLFLGVTSVVFSLEEMNVVLPLWY